LKSYAIGFDVTDAVGTWLILSRIEEYIIGLFFLPSHLCVLADYCRSKLYSD